MQPDTSVSRWSADELRRLDRLLDDALSLPPQARGDWLNKLAGEDAALREPLQHMLEQTREGSGFMAHPVSAHTLSEVAEDMDGDRPGDTLGDYQLIRKLGSGGMSLVWLARDHQRVTNREVALKLPKNAWLPETSARMRQEWTILAGLEHPGIARLYDAGWLQDGRPFLAMEYVDGEPIDRHVAQHIDSVEGIVQLMLQVADALAFAHGRLVVHRDIKPSNILVDKAGRARLLDFGVARLLDGHTAWRSDLTRAGGRMLTPGYASPEQIAGQPLTVTTDVFSLGVVLFELLTGSRPHRPGRDTPAALEDAILRDDASLASRVARDVRRRKRLRGDMDAILAKALDRDREKRYASMAEFADDLRAFIAGLPVKAQPERWSYRTRKFVRRHFLGVSMLALLLLSLTGGLAAVLWQAGLAREQARMAALERDHALKELRYAQATEEFIRMVLSEGLSQDRPAAESLRLGEQTLRDQFASQPVLRGRMQLALAQLYSELEDQDRRTAMIGEARESGKLSQDAELQDAIQCVAAGDFFTRGRHAEALGLFNSTIKRVESRADKSGFALQICLTERSGTLRVLGHWSEALSDARRALALLDPDSPGNYSKVVGLRSQIADALTLSGDFHASVNEHRSLVEQYFGPGRRRTMLGLYVANHYILSLARAGQAHQAEAEFRRMLDLLGLERNNTYSPLMHNHARLLVSMERFDEAERELTRMRQSQGARRNRSLGLFSGLFPAMVACSRAMWDACRQRIDESYLLVRDDELDRHSIHASHLWVRAWAAQGSGDLQTALVLVDRSIAVYGAARDRNPYLVRARIQRASILAALGRQEDALQEAERALTDAQQFTRGFPHSEWLGRALHAKGDLLALRGEQREAAVTLDLARTHLANSLGVDAAPTRAAARAAAAIQARTVTQPGSRTDPHH